MIKIIETPDGEKIELKTGDKLYINSDSSDVDFPYTVCRFCDGEEEILEYFDTIENAKYFMEQLLKELAPPTQSLF